MDQVGHTESLDEALEDFKSRGEIEDTEAFSSLINKFKDIKLMYHKNDNRMILDTILKDTADGGLHLDIVGSEVKLPIEVKVGRNDPCPCGSGKKYKKCCLNA